MSGGSGGDRRLKNFMWSCLSIVFILMLAQAIIQQLMPLLPFAVAGAAMAATVYFIFKHTGRL